MQGGKDTDQNAILKALKYTISIPKKEVHRMSDYCDKTTLNL
jgi:hypothetical protein